MTIRRKAIPERIKRIIEARQDGKCFCNCNASILPGSDVEFDHSPSLKMRPINASGDDYVPGQLDPDYIVARCSASHRRKTLGPSQASSVGGDIHAIAKIKRILKKRDGIKKPGRNIQSQGFSKTHTKGFDGRVRLRT